MILFVNQHESVLVDMVGTRKGAKIELFYSVSERYPRLTLLFSGFSKVYYFVCVWPTALKLGCLNTNFDILFLKEGSSQLFLTSKVVHEGV